MSHAVLLLGPGAPGALRVAVRSLELSVVTMSDQAAEVHLPEGNAAKLANALLERGGFDVGLVPLEGREKKLLLCDMDSTMIGEESLDELAEAFGFGKKVRDITEKAMRGELAFDEALRARVKLFAGLSIDAAATALRERITVNEGADILVRTMVARGARAALVTGGFDIFAAPVGEKLGFHDVYANRLRSADGVLSGEVAEPILGPNAKKARLDDLCAELSLEPSDVVAVGDGANDKAMIEAAGLGIGYRPKPVLAKASDAVLQHADLTAILSLQGVPQADWVMP
ncbi:phosphoserine phosphatase SerB [Parvularcula sp. ZS-1/3]|uniref:Phosphoserine phosphatase n=1 Tax=Parvularcula mediterranea TaxID=2732508 RepID=A0A7Y3W6C1_9PROT|nr:phosphoserine phosphatase SerB [Parvularcula mediterranea]NNU17378.1 phosphoserine phosphatase SerB [Parvularcula mediterranea]